jgi:hypothetical protein
MQGSDRTIPGAGMQGPGSRREPLHPLRRKLQPLVLAICKQHVVPPRPRVQRQHLAFVPPAVAGEEQREHTADRIGRRRRRCDRRGTGARESLLLARRQHRSERLHGRLRNARPGLGFQTLNSAQRTTGSGSGQGLPSCLAPAPRATGGATPMRCTRQPQFLSVPHALLLPWLPFLCG